jgi:hypothetical protein
MQQINWGLTLSKCSSNEFTLRNFRRTWFYLQHDNSRCSTVKRTWQKSHSGGVSRRRRYEWVRYVCPTRRRWMSVSSLRGMLILIRQTHLNCVFGMLMPLLPAANHPSSANPFLTVCTISTRLQKTSSSTKRWIIWLIPHRTSNGKKAKTVTSIKTFIENTD